MILAVANDVPRRIRGIGIQSAAINRAATPIFVPPSRSLRAIKSDISGGAVYRDSAKTSPRSGDQSPSTKTGLCASHPTRHWFFKIDDRLQPPPARHLLRPSNLISRDRRQARRFTSKRTNLPDKFARKTMRRIAWSFWKRDRERERERGRLLYAHRNGNLSCKNSKIPNSSKIIPTQFNLYIYIYIYIHIYIYIYIIYIYKYTHVLLAEMYFAQWQNFN